MARRIWRVAKCARVRCSDWQAEVDVGSDAGLSRRTGAGNAWSVIAADPARGLVFVPTGSPSPDYFGGERLGDDLYANSLGALDAATGKRVWHFQTVHHDLWDYDVASPPILFDVRRAGSVIPVAGVGSKSGNFFVLDRATGKPIFGVEERAVPQTDVAGEKTAPTQPPFLLHRRGLLRKAPVCRGGATESDRAFCAAEMGKLLERGCVYTAECRGLLFSCRETLAVWRGAGRRMIRLIECC